MDGIPDGPFFSVEPGAEPYPELMNRGAIAEIAAIDPDAVVVKGDLTCDGLDEEYAAFLAAYGTAFGDRLHHVRGNHDALPPPDVRPGGSAADRRRRPHDRPPRHDDPRPHHRPGARRAARVARGPGRRGRPAGARARPPPRVEPGRQRRGPTTTSASTPTTPSGSSRPSPGTRGSSATPPATPTATGCDASRRRGDRPWIEVACVKDYPGTLGRVPRVRRRRAPGPPPHLHPRGARRGPSRPAACSPAPTASTRSASSATAASRCVAFPATEAAHPVRRLAAPSRDRSARRAARGHPRPRPGHRDRRARAPPATSPTTAPTCSRSSGPAPATAPAAWACRDPADGTSLYWKLVVAQQALHDRRPQDRRRARRRSCAWSRTPTSLIENFRPGTLERLGLGPDVLLERNPTLVILRVTGFGQDGPYAGRAGFATIAEAMSGFASINGEPDGGPLLPPIALTDEVTALVGCVRHDGGAVVGRGPGGRREPARVAVPVHGSAAGRLRRHRLPAAAPRVRHPVLGAPRHLAVRGRPLGRGVHVGRVGRRAGDGPDRLRRPRRPADLQRPHRGPRRDRRAHGRLLRRSHRSTRCSSRSRTPRPPRRPSSTWPTSPPTRTTPRAARSSRSTACRCRASWPACRRHPGAVRWAGRALGRRRSRSGSPPS